MADVTTWAAIVATGVGSVAVLGQAAVQVGQHRLQTAQAQQQQADAWYRLRDDWQRCNLAAVGPSLASNWGIPEPEVVAFQAMLERYRNADLAWNRIDAT